jgi:hypothetical protein
VLSGLVVAVVTGVVFGLLRDDFWSGVVTGVLYGIALPLVMRMGNRSTAMDDLTLQQRRAVMRKLRHGEGTDDPELAPALIEQGTEILATPFTPKVTGIAAGVLFAFGATATVLAIAKVGGLGLALGLPLIIISLGLVYMIVALSERRRGLVVQAVDATKGSVHKG